MALTRVNMVDGIIEGGMDFQGRTGFARLATTGADRHKVRVVNVRPGTRIPSVTLLFEGASRFAGQEMEISGDSFNNLLAHSITYLDIHPTTTAHA